MSAPAAAAFPSVKLHDTSVVQSIGFDTTNRVWILAQVMAGGHFGQSYTTHASHGDLTLTKVSAAGTVLGHMYLLGFSHGGSIGVQGVGGRTDVWVAGGKLPASAHPSGIETAGGVMTVRVPWRNSATVSAWGSGVERFGDNAGQPFQAPSVNVAADLIAVRYYSRALKVIRWAVYRLSVFARHHYAAIARYTVPSAAFQPNLQGWAPVPGHVLALTGHAYSASNAPPGNTAIVDTETSTGRAVGQVPVTAGAWLSYREPEGLTAMGDNVCVGFASGPLGGRLANVYCQRRV